RYWRLLLASTLLACPAIAGLQAQTAVTAAGGNTSGVMLVNKMVMTNNSGTLKVRADTTAEQMLSWNGSAWIKVPPGNEGQISPYESDIPSNKTQPLSGDVLNPVTGKIWMDRNLGATQVATSSTDANSYGHLYQWGRGSDGHQFRTSGTTTKLSSTNTPGHGKFIRVPKTPYDWRSPQNDNLWQGVSGVNNPCPDGYRLPTEAEWNAERLSWSSNNAVGAFTSPLKLPVAGYRSFAASEPGHRMMRTLDRRFPKRQWGGLYLVDLSGYYWSSTVSGIFSRSLSFIRGNASMGSFRRADGYSVRCIKD
ncbi:MAG: FISUMP domain-containing protein, partial [Bacteroidales bacterium]